MFQPLLDVFADSVHLSHSQEKKPLKLGVSLWYGDAIKDFKSCCFDYILNSQFTITYSTCEPCDIVFGASFRLEGLSRPILNFSQRRIGYTGESERINFDIYDFGMGFDHLIFHERYLRVPLYYTHLWTFLKLAIMSPDSPFKVDERTKQAFYKNYLELNSNYQYTEKAPHCTITLNASFKDNYPHLYLLAKNQSDPLQRGFASFVASNPNAPMRNACYQELCAYRPVAGGGGVFNTIGKPIKNKWEFLSQHKFNLCFENSKDHGYTTEKIVDAYFAHTIPIYWGNPVVARDFNPKSFVNVHDFKDFKEVLDYVRYLDTHDNAYLEMLHAHPLNTIEGQPKFHQDLSFAKILAFLQNAIYSTEIYHNDGAYSMTIRELLNLLTRKLSRKIKKR
ncbi:glycosyltransferase family 10 domain-containing protein [Helicobacter salomonis]|uniref:glycosyltransferase family 10 domain-containing protein n=1 Tax=Helicobacter salomonis TaxID=56878 RepID=UPI001315582E|nr:glycosyltransferase family 10 [Helicobacter salomonis]